MTVSSCAGLLFLATVAFSGVDGFQVANQAAVRVPTTRVFSTVPIEPTVAREVGPFQDWAAQCGVQVENGFCLTGDLVDGNEDWYAVTSTGGKAGSRVLYVPNQMILSSSRIAQEYQGYVEPSFQVLDQRGLQHLYPQFYLFLRILVEYEQGAESPYYPWVAALPRKWNTAASMDEFCLSCLPPFIKNLCQVEKHRLAVFQEALQAFEYLSPEGKVNGELAKWAYNVVITRSVPITDTEHQIIPLADMFNHGYPPNAEIYSDENGDCQVILTEDVEPGQPLYVSYGRPANQSRFLATYGFLNESEGTFCKISFPNPSQQMIDIGYDPERMIFSTSDGSISPEVWDVMLFSRLEKKKELEGTKDLFYQAHITGDEETKATIHQQFFEDTRKALLRHVDFVLSEIFELRVHMNAFDSSKHPRLPLIKKHNELVFSTFRKVRANLVA